MLLSTLEAYFQGKKELFEGLAISQLEQEWKEYPILHLDLNTEKYDSVEALENKLSLALSNWEELYGNNPNEKSLGTRFEGVIRRACEQTGLRAVILVDEYDKPLLQAIGTEPLQAEYRSTLKAFYGALKSCDRLWRDFDGYHFCIGSEGIYNPFSLLNTLARGQFGDYWFETGTPTFLVHQLQKTDYQLDHLTEEELTVDVLNSIDIMDENPLPLLYQSGYLTLKSYDARLGLYRLGYPNREVREGFIKYLLPFYTPKTRDKSAYHVSRFVRDVRSGDADGFMRRLESLFSQGDYAVMGDREVYFHNSMYVLFMLLGFYIDVERHTTNGRMDILVQTADYIYLFELKINQSAAMALRQIDEKGYAAAFSSDSRRLYKIGVNFSTETRRIDDWKIVCNS